MRERNNPFVIVSKKQEQRNRDGHPWVYADEVTETGRKPENGGLCDVFGNKGGYLGTGFYNDNSKIIVRLLGNNPNDRHDDAFFERRVRYAVEYRKDVMQDDIACCRIVHGEADGIPGLTIDRYGNALVSEITCLGTELRKEVIYGALARELENIDGIYERNENPLRLKEGMELYAGWHNGAKTQDTIIEIVENGLRYEVDIANGQKTGFFLDQKLNRLSVRRLAKGKTVLDCCTHTGSFAMNAAVGGALNVVAMDISETALTTARRNAQLNNLDIEFVKGDVFEMLSTLKKEHAYYDFIILDPPAFAKSRKAFANARQGYRNINALALSLLPRGGYLATCSCSHFMPAPQFRQMLRDAAKDVNCSIRIIEQRGASYDHPVLASVEETEYLKFFLLQKI